MKVKRLLTFFLPFLLIFAISGTRVAHSWDFSDFQDSQLLHIEQADPADNDMEEAKEKLLPLLDLASAAPIIVAPHQLILAQFFVPDRNEKPLRVSTRLLPSRASPL